MNLLFVWNGCPFPDKYRFYIDRAFELYPEANRFCITDQVDLPFNDYIAVEKEEIARLILKKYDIGIAKLQLFKEWASWTFLSENKYTLYYDVDLYFKSRFQVTDKTGFYKWDECCLWSGNNPGAFHKALLNRKTSAMLNGCINFLPQDSIDLKPYCIHKYNG